jgi:hypothetical protein
VTRRLRTAPLCAGLALALVASGCGSGGAKRPETPPATNSSVSVPQTSSARAPAAPVAHLSILSPRPDAHTAPTLTVRVALTGAPADAAQTFRYVLDHRLTRSGSDRLTFHDLAPGRHHLEVISPGTGPSRATTTFTVRAPAQSASLVAAQPQPTPTVSTPVAVPTTSAPPKQAPEPANTTTPPPPKASPPPSSGGIPQGPNAGDGDGDNHGGPSDGDGNI